MGRNGDGRAEFRARVQADAYLVSIDARTGQPDKGSARAARSISTYLHNTQQYIVVATGSGPTAELIALGLP
jgi:hypothetical protein